MTSTASRECLKCPLSTERTPHLTLSVWWKKRWKTRTCWKAPLTRASTTTLKSRQGLSALRHREFWSRLKNSTTKWSEMSRRWGTKTCPSPTSSPRWWNTNQWFECPKILTWFITVRKDSRRGPETLWWSKRNIKRWSLSRRSLEQSRKSNPSS